MVSAPRNYDRKNTAGYRASTGVGIQLGIRIAVCLASHVARLTYMLKPSCSSLDYSFSYNLKGLSEYQHRVDITALFVSIM